MQRELSIVSATDSTFSEESIEEFKQIFDKFEKLNSKISESTSLVSLADAAPNAPYDPLAIPDAVENTTGINYYLSLMHTHSLIHSLAQGYPRRKPS